jgi:hypothetical protein
MTRTVTVRPHPAHAELVARFTPDDLPDDRAPLPHEMRLRIALNALHAVVTRHQPEVSDGWVVCADCAQGVPPEGHPAAMWANAIYPCPTIRDIVGDHGYGLAIRDADWAAGNTAMLRASGRSCSEVTQAAVLAAATAEDAPIWASLTEPTPPTDEQETPA